MRPAPATRSVHPLLACLVALGACDCDGSSGPPDPAASAPIGGLYRAAVQAEGAPPVPFLLSLPADADRAGAIVNGEQRLEVDHAWTGARVNVPFPLYDTRIEARANASGALSGTWVNESPAFGGTELAFTAEPIDEADPRAKFPADGTPAPAGEVAEVWRLSVPELGIAKLRLVRSDGAATRGLIRFATGNTVHLAGVVRGDRVQLSAFDGTSPYLLDATISRDDGGASLRGRWLAGPALDWRAEITGTAGAFELELDPRVSGTGALNIPELAAPPYEGAPTIVELTGSWSPAARHAAPVLRTLHDAYQDRGLEVLTLVYEFTGDEDHNQAKAAELEERLDLPWRVVPIDGTVEEYWDILPAGLEGVVPQGFPITLFVDRSGAVRAIRAGAPPPVAKDRHVEVLREFRDLALKIVEPAP